MKNILVSAVLIGSVSFGMAQAEEKTPERFLVQEGTVLDQKSGLRWQRCIFGTTWISSNKCVGMPQTFTFSQVVKLKATKFPDSVWRVPTKNELASILEVVRNDPAVGGSLFPGAKAKVGSFWSSDLHNEGQAWFADFKQGYVGYISGDYDNVGHELYVRLVSVED